MAAPPGRYRPLGDLPFPVEPDMAFEQPQVDGLPSADQSPCRFKVRIRFKKCGDLRFLSHHDLMHCFERMFRRGSLPVKASQGFHPMPRMAFALSLALGI